MEQLVVSEYFYPVEQIFFVRSANRNDLFIYLEIIGVNVDYFRNVYNVGPMHSDEFFMVEAIFYFF